MIVRIMGEGQFEVPDDALSDLNEVDTRLQSAVDGNDTAAFESTLKELLGTVRTSGTRCSDEYLGASDHVLPGEASTLEEVRDLLGDEGLLPG